MKKSKKKQYLPVICLLAAVVLLGAGILVYYQTQYYLVLNGESKVTLNLCQVYEDPGVSAKQAGKDVSSQVKIESDLDTQTPGTYKISYSLGNLSTEREVTVGETMDPVLELSGEEDFQVKLGESFKEPGFSAADSSGGDLTDQVKVDMPELNRAGASEIVYTVADSSGKKTRMTRKVEVLPNTEYDTPGLPVCMYHYVYDEKDPPADLNQRFGNYIECHDLEEELEWLKSEDYYFPTWQEVRDYVDGKLLLPEKSIVLCFDDGAKSFLEVGIPVLEKRQVPATCFMITTGSGAKKVQDYQSDYVYYESHSDNMHRAGGNIGHGGIFTALSEEEALTDLKASIEKCGSGDAFAYPYGDYTQQCRDTVEKAGFLCAVTTEGGKAKPGMDPMLLPRVRMSMGQSLQQFQSMVAPPTSQSTDSL